MIRFLETSLVVPISVESVTNVEWRRAQFIRKGSRNFDSPNLSRFPQTPVGGHPENRDVEVLEELEEVPEDSSYPDIYDFVSILLYQQEPRDVIMVHDDDVIIFLPGDSKESNILESNTTTSVNDGDTAGVNIGESIGSGVESETESNPEK